MNKKMVEALYGIYGAGGCGRGVMPIASENLANLENTQLCFVDDRSIANVLMERQFLAMKTFGSPSSKKIYRHCHCKTKYPKNWLYNARKTDLNLVSHIKQSYDL